MKRIIAFLIFIIVLAGGIFAFMQYSGKFKTKNPAVQEDNQQIKSETKNISEKDTENNRDIKSNYLQFSGIKNQDAQDKINQNIKQNADNSISDFKKNAGSCSFSDITGPEKPNWSCEYASEDSYEFAGKILSVKTETYQFMGGAHGGTFFEFLNYNIDTGEKINWKDTFKKDSGFMQKISEIAKTEVTKKLQETTGDNPYSDTGWVERGTEPTDENYNTNVGFAPDGLVIIFQQYQVAPYALGPQEIKIPYSDLKEYINQELIVRQI